jgi:hypothetical protein
MRIFAKVKTNARSRYVADPNNITVNWKWADTLEAVEGQEIEIETKFLFLNQFNTAPIPGVSDNGLRLMATSLESLRIEDGTFEDVKAQIRAFYLESWHQKITDAQFSAWESLLNK